jgi:hypothetical protein
MSALRSLQTCEPDGTKVALNTGLSYVNKCLALLAKGKFCIQKYHKKIDS